MQMTITNGNWPFHQPSLSNESKQWEGIHPWSESQSLDGIPLKIQSWLFFLFTYDHSSSPCQGSFCSNEEVIYSHLLRHDLKLLKYKLFLGCMSNIQSINYRSKISNPVDNFGLQLRYYPPTKDIIETLWLSQNLSLLRQIENRGRLPSPWRASGNVYACRCHRVWPGKSQHFEGKVAPGITIAVSAGINLNWNGYHQLPCCVNHSNPLSSLQVWSNCPLCTTCSDEFLLLMVRIHMAWWWYWYLIVRPST